MFNGVIDSPEKEKKSLKRGKGDTIILFHTITPKIEIILSKLDGVLQKGIAQRQQLGL